MNRTWLALWVVVVLVLGSGGLAGAADGSLARVKKAGVLTVCAVDGLLPYSSSDKRTPGFEVEIAQAVARELGVAVRHHWTTWDGLIPALTSKRCDAIIDGMFITPERQKVIAFSRPYYGSGETILVRKDNTTIRGLADLKGKRVGVLSGSVTVEYLRKKGIATLVVYPDQNTIILELNNGRIEAAYLEAPSAAWALKKDPTLNIKIVKEYVPEERFNAAVGLRKTDRELLDAINAAVTKLGQRGTIARILGKYGVPFYPAKLSSFGMVCTHHT